MTPEGFWARVVEEGDCLVWTGSKTKGRCSGYGYLSWEGRRVFAHRVAFFLRLGRWPDGILRHLCNNPSCVLHAVEGTHSENAKDVVDAGYHMQASKTECIAGHPFDEANTYMRLGHRYCRECDRIRHAARRAAKRAA